jgi:hypothetical protein
MVLRNIGVSCFASWALLAAPVWPNGCNLPGTGVGGAPAVCGDGALQAGEECDGAALGGNTCVSINSNSTEFAGGTLKCQGCRFDFSACTRPTCGDGKVEGFESCDGANLGKTPYCKDLGGPYIGGMFSCMYNCTYQDQLCVHTVCGDGKIEGIEECEGADMGAYAGKDCRDFLFGGIKPYASGSLKCTSDRCLVDMTGCTLPPGCGYLPVVGNPYCSF